MDLLLLQPPLLTRFPCLGDHPLLRPLRTEQLPAVQNMDHLRVPFLLPSLPPSMMRPLCMPEIRHQPACRARTHSIIWKPLLQSLRPCIRLLRLEVQDHLPTVLVRLQRRLQTGRKPLGSLVQFSVFWVACFCCLSPWPAGDVLAAAARASAGTTSGSGARHHRGPPLASSPRLYWGLVYPEQAWIVSILPRRT